MTETPSHDSTKVFGSAAPAVQRTEVQWQEILSPEEYAVLRQAGTERPFTGEYWDEFSPGTYSCRACGNVLFASDTKFDARCGWPSFFAPLAEDRVRYIRDVSLGMERIEVQCARCGSHLGHVFEGEGLGTPTDLRYCMNSASLVFAPAQDDAEGNPSAVGPSASDSREDR